MAWCIRNPSTGSRFRGANNSGVVDKATCTVSGASRNCSGHPCSDCSHHSEAEAGLPLHHCRQRPGGTSFLARGRGLHAAGASVSLRASPPASQRPPARACSLHCRPRCRMLASPQHTAQRPVWPVVPAWYTDAGRGPRKGCFASIEEVGRWVHSIQAGDCAQQCGLHSGFRAVRTAPSEVQGGRPGPGARIEVSRHSPGEQVESGRPSALRLLLRRLPALRPGRVDTALSRVTAGDTGAQGAE